MRDTYHLLTGGLLVLLLALPIRHNNCTTVFAEPDTEPIREQQWVDSIFGGLSETERIGQLLMIRAHSDKGEDYEQKVGNLIKNYQVGGLCFFQGTPLRQAELTNEYQSYADVPMLIAMDAEWGLGMRFKEHAISFPRQLMLGAIQDNRLLYYMGKEIARQCRRLGVHINFAPVVDVNNNPENPVINDRSFGEDRENVTVKSYMYATGMQDHGLMACAKHFPGHGDTDVDSHYDLPVIQHDYERLDSIELYPFRQLVQRGIQSVMIAHLSIPALDDTPNLPSTLSSDIVNGLLIDSLNFKGLVITDGLGMKGVTKHYVPGEVEVRALMAGNDLLLLPQDVPATIRAIQEAIKEGRLTQARIDQKVKKILHIKYRLGLHRQEPIETVNLERDLHTPQAYLLREQLIRNALTMVRNPSNLIPFRRLDTLSMASLSIGVASKTSFQETLDLYANLPHHQVNKAPTPYRAQQLIDELKNRDVVIVSLHNMSKYARREFGIPLSTRQFLRQLSQHTKIVLVVFGSPYSLTYFDNIPWVLQAYDEAATTQLLSAQALFGGFSINGKLPVTASPRSPYGAGRKTGSLMRLQYTLPESVGMSTDSLHRIDTIVQHAIDIGATPGCQVLVAKEGKVIYHKAFGHYTYVKKRPVTLHDLYDIASITKVAATTLGVMKLREQKRLDLNRPLVDYLPELDSTNKGKLIVRDILAHRSSLQAWLPFYVETLTKAKRPDSKFYRTALAAPFTIPVTDRLYLHQSYPDTIWQRIIASELRQRKEYHYSDLGFYFLQRLIQTTSGEALDAYLDRRFYVPLGLSTMTYNPLDKYPRSRIVPSEEDKYFRHQVIKGHVHDMGAAMMGGVAGHAGLFANANDIAILTQMLLNGGYYGGRAYFLPQTIRLFTARPSKSTRRGLGFDMTELNRSKSSNLSSKASTKTFGHQGFTGTAVWADPDEELIYIFLSNRTYPSMNNWKLNKEDIRLHIQNTIYNAIAKN